MLEPCPPRHCDKKPIHSRSIDNTHLFIYFVNRMKEGHQNVVLPDLAATMIALMPQACQQSTFRIMMTVTWSLERD